MQIKCQKCGEEFFCGADSADRSCWCLGFANIMPVPDQSENASCWCESCLKEIISKKDPADS